MMDKGIYKSLVAGKAEGKKRLAVLIDPDKTSQTFNKTLEIAIRAKVDFIFIGGSLLVNNQLDTLLEEMRQQCNIPLILFPGSSFQLSYRADALLFLSLISGRNPELLIGQHVISAPFLKVSPLEIISTGYILIDGGVRTSVQYMSNTQPIPSSKTDIAVCTAVAGEMLGLKMMYLEAGSGAHETVPLSMIEQVSSAIAVPLIVGGGIRNAERISDAFHAGADLVVVGNVLEKSPELLVDMAEARFW